jgi:hypothetical protein
LSTFAGVIDLNSHSSSALHPPKATPANLNAIPDTSSMVPRFRGDDWSPAILQFALHAKL